MKKGGGMYFVNSVVFSFLLNEQENQQNFCDGIEYETHKLLKSKSVTHQFFARKFSNLKLKMWLVGKIIRV